MLGRCFFFLGGGGGQCVFDVFTVTSVQKGLSYTRLVRSLSKTTSFRSFTMTLLVEMIGYLVGEGETLSSPRPYLLLRSTLCAFQSH